MDKTKLYFWVLLDVLVLVAIVNVVFFVMPMLNGLKNSFPVARTITVSAQGMTVATPDEGDISFSVISQGQSPKALSDDNNTKMNAVIKFVAGQGVASSDIATTGYDLQPNYSYTNYGPNIPSRPPTINGYTLTQTVQVKIRDLTKVADVLGGLAPLGVNNISGVNFTFQDPNKFIGIARGDALTKAQSQAAQMAAQAGASLGTVINIGESSYVPQPYYKDYSVNSAAGGVMAAPVAPTIQPGTQNVTDQVTVTYQLN